MRFGAVPLPDALGAVLAHSLSKDGVRLRKGDVLAASDLTALTTAGFETVTVARLDPGDVEENEAARRVAAALGGPHLLAHPPTTGRVNLHAATAGLFKASAERVNALNGLDEAVTLATLPDNTPVAPGQMVATVKIIPFAVPEPVLRAAEALAKNGAMALRPFQPRRVALVQTTLPSLKGSVLDKTARVTQDRLTALGSALVHEARVPHTADAVAAALDAALPQADLVLLFGASAVCDDLDVLPAAIRLVGGRVVRFGMPVDPGNLMVLAAVGETPVLGAPGCARSSKENGFDWVLRRVCAGERVDGIEMAGLGVGGLLAEIPTRPQPREAPPAPATPRVTAAVLAAGRSSRMKGTNKLLARFHETPLVRVVTERALASRAAETLVVTGHDAERVAHAVSDLPARLVPNPDYAAGLSASLKAAIAALDPDTDGLLVVLGDMPNVETRDLDRLVDAFAASGGRIPVRATANGKRGNPVILPRALFPALAALSGDTGARHLLEAGPVIDVELGDAAALDVDTPDALAAAGGVAQE